MSTTPLPPQEVRSALARAAVDNADRFLTDASTLLAAGSAPSAHSDADEVQLPAEITVAEAEEMISLSRWAHRGVRGLFIDGTGFEPYRFGVPSEEQHAAG